MAPDTTKPDAAALLPCPFCGAQPDARDVGPEWVECPSCGCAGPADPYRSREDAWNRRTALAQRPESAHPAIRLTRINGMCVVALCIDGREVPVIQDNGDFISHYVEPLGIAQALKRHGITNSTKGDAR